MYNAVWRNNKLYAAFTEAFDWGGGGGTVAAVRYLRINTSTNLEERDGLDEDVRCGPERAPLLEELMEGLEDLAVSGLGVDEQGVEARRVHERAHRR
jgi:hypothetical protein